MSQHTEIARELLHRFTREEYDRLVEVGAFGEDDRVELLRGMIVQMSPQGPRHAMAVEALTEILVLALAGRARVRPQLPHAASDDSEPEPDLLVAPKGPRNAHPQQALLVVEVADSSLRHDRRIKLPIYAEAGVPEVWIVNLVDDVVEVYREPRGSAYGSMMKLAAGDTLVVGAFPDVQIAVSDIL